MFQNELFHHCAVLSGYSKQLLPLFCKPGSFAQPLAIYQCCLEKALMNHQTNMPYNQVCLQLDEVIKGWQAKINRHALYIVSAKGRDGL